MDSPNGVKHMRPDLAAFLETFEALPEDDQTLIRQQLGQQGRDKARAVDSDHTTIPLQFKRDQMHSCYICKQLVIFHRSLAESNTDERVLDVDHITLTKDSLRQGLVHKCVLVEWIMPMLARGLRDLKQDLSKSVNDPSRIKTMHDVADDLQYISAGGLTVSCQSWERDGEAQLHIEYEAEPYLIDRLWEATHGVRTSSSYRNFALQYDENIEAPFRVAFPSSKCVIRSPPSPARLATRQVKSQEMCHSMTYSVAIHTNGAGLTAHYIIT
ncbi:hypothetical protein DE146DRAFT_122039 [Phaeosphaeria sp. MPI-PUGE-AT-0046c]|nr:hypothetical protein DE146DRAFT_122039 [Phaeosphaeria sp. MPI-PUGE-AT-0046c]